MEQPRLNLKCVDVYLTITKVGNDHQSVPSKEHVIPVSALHGKYGKSKLMESMKSQLMCLPWNSRSL